MGQFTKQFARGSLVAALVTALCGCSSDTGILIEVTLQEQLAGIRADSLLFYIQPVGPEDTADRLANPIAVDFSTGRDLISDPYLLMLHRGDIGEDSVIVAAVGTVSGAADGRLGGALSQPVPFADGEIRRWKIALDLLEEDAAGCVTITGVNRDITVGPASDFDCDGQTEREGDCQDNNPDVFLGAIEVCDGQDNNCDGVCDEDLDGDLLSTCGSFMDPAAPNECLGIDTTVVDCADDPALNSNAALMRPGNDEPCDGIDNDCSGWEDDPFDEDMDGYDRCGSALARGGNPVFLDCVEGNSLVSPSAIEFCDGTDTNCDDTNPISETCYLLDGLGVECYDGRITCNDGAPIDPFTGDCEVNVGSRKVPIALCDAYIGCSTSPGIDRLDCTYSELSSSPTHVSCDMHWVDNGDFTYTRCLSSPPQLSMDPATCSWRVHGGKQQSVYGVSLRDPMSGGDVQFLSVCNALLVVTTAGRWPRNERFMLEKRTTISGSELFVVDINYVIRDTCPLIGFDCPLFPPNFDIEPI